MLARPIAKFAKAGARQALRKDRADAGTHRRRVVGIGSVAEQNRPGRAHGVAGAQNRAQVAGVLHRVERNPAASGGGIQFRKRMPALPQHKPQALRVFTRRQAGENIWRYVSSRHAARHDFRHQIAAKGAVQQFGRDHAPLDWRALLHSRRHKVQPIHKICPAVIALLAAGQRANCFDQRVVAAADRRLPHTIFF